MGFFDRLKQSKQGDKHDQPEPNEYDEYEDTYDQYDAGHETERYVCFFARKELYETMNAVRVLS